MKQLLRWIALSIAVVVTLAACTSTETNANATPPAPVDPAILGDKQTNTSGMFPSDPLTKVGNTGRPQFLNGFADW